MEQKKNEIKIELTPEVANGHYANLAVISHSASEFFLDFIAVAPNMPQAKVQSRIIMTPENAKNLFFFGPPGLGKKYLSSAVAKTMLDKGYTVIYTGASKLFAAYDDFRFGRMSEPEEFEDMLKLLYDADLLIIDDLGVEMHGPSSFQFLFDLMNDRFLKNKRMIISTNLSMEDISKNYTTRITSRIYENFNCLRFAGTDIRTQKLIRKKQGK